MINCHYIPQLILRHFCFDNKISYCDVENRRIELRNTKSVFSEKSYYPDELEKGLCDKVEVQFANILNNKILCNRNRFVLTSEEMFILKKFLIITVLRVKNSDINIDELIPDLNSDEIYKLEGNFFENINKILNCKTKEEAFKYTDIINGETNLNLYAYIKDILCSYTVFVRTNNSKENFLIPDKGYASYEGPIHVKKLTGVIELAMKLEDQFLFQIANMLTPHDYSIFPIAYDMAIIKMSPFFKLCIDGSAYNIVFPQEALTLSKVLGFGSSQIISAPKIKNLNGRSVEYSCEVKQLSKSDVYFLNSLLLGNVKQYFAFADIELVKNSIKYTEQLSDEIDYSFLL